MNESEFWPRLEYRVTRELAGMVGQDERSLWCDGFLPDPDIDGEPIACLGGKVWMGIGRRGQQPFDFTLVLPRSVSKRDNIDWESLLPSADVTRWLSVDRDRRQVVIEPAAAIPDAG